MFYTEKEAAGRLGLSAKTMQQWRWRGEGPRYCKFGRAVRYSAQDLAAFVEASARQSTSDPGNDRARN